MHIEDTIQKAYYSKSAIAIYSALVFGYFYSTPATAIDWFVTPTVQFQELYSDNLNPFTTSANGLSTAQKKEKKAGFATVVSPGVSIIGRSARNMINLSYNLQGIYNRDGNEGVNLYNQLQFGSQHTLISNRLFVQTSSSISQQNINNIQQRTDNIGNANRTNVSTVNVSPYWTPHFGTFANGLFRVNLSTVSTGTNTTSVIANNGSIVPTNFSDSVTVGEVAQLNSGNDFKTITWNATYNNSKTYRSGGDDVSFQSYYGTIRNHINKSWNIFATAGESDSNLGNAINLNNSIPNNINGFYYTFGAQWRPNDNFFIEAGGGNNSYVTVSMSPMRRVSWVTTYRHNAVGLNNGDTWQTNLNYQARNSTWYLSHINNTITSQQAISNSITGNQNQGLGNNLPPVNTLGIYNFYNDVYITKTWSLGFSYLTGKSTFGANAFNQDITSTAKTIFSKETVRGLTGFWNWQFAPKTSAYFRPMWQQIHGVTAATKNDYYDVSVGMTRSITTRLTGSLEFRHIDQAAGLDANSYQENRATASLYMRF